MTSLQTSDKLASSIIDVLNAANCTPMQGFLAVLGVVYLMLTDQEFMQKAPEPVHKLRDACEGTLRPLLFLIPKHERHCHN